MRHFTHILHWIGFFMTCVMLILSFLDPSGDEHLIHFVASMTPITVAWLIAYLIDESRKFFPFMCFIFLFLG